MLKLIIAEDGDLERATLEKIIDWNELGIELCAVASNGQEALELIQKHQPDILFTDIKMPIKDGIWLAKETSREYENIKIVFISAYDEFDYAKTAINVKAFQYILKPYEIDELKAVVAAVASKCYEDKNRILEDEKLRQQVRESLPLLKEKFLKELINHAFKEDSRMDNRTEFLGIGFIQRETVVIVIELDEYNRIKEELNVEELYLVKFRLCNLVEEILQKSCNGIVIETGENEFTIFIEVHADQRYKSFISEISEEIRKDISLNCGYTATLGISGKSEHSGQLAECYRSAQEALRHKLYLDKNNVIWKDDVKTGSCKVYPDMSNLENSIVLCVKTGDKDGTIYAIGQLFDMLQKDASLPATYLRSVCMRLVNALSMAMTELDDSLKSVCDEIELIEKLIHFETIIDIKQWVVNIFSFAADYIVQRQKDWNIKIVEKMKEIIHKRYFDEISIDDIANSVFLSAGYATTLFKKYTGESLMKYIIKTRVERAKELLKDESLKIYEVCQQVGYTNIAYFCSIFKNHVGVSPKEYRDTLGVRE